MYAPRVVAIVAGSYITCMTAYLAFDLCFALLWIGSWMEDEYTYTYGVYIYVYVSLSLLA